MLVPRLFVKPAPPVTKVRISDLLFDERPGSDRSRKYPDGSMARRRSRVVKDTDPAGNESCLGRGRAEMPIALKQPSPFAHATIRRAAPAPASGRKYIQLSSDFRSRVRFARDALNVPSPDGTSNQNRAKSTDLLRPHHVATLMSSLTWAISAEYQFKSHVCTSPSVCSLRYVGVRTNHCVAI